MRRMIIVNLVLMATLLLSACANVSNSAAPAVEEPQSEAPEAAAPVEEVAVSDPEGCLGSVDTAIVDLACREITIAVENAYLPFNYISLETG